VGAGGGLAAHGEVAEEREHLARLEAAHELAVPLDLDRAEES